MSEPAWREGHRLLAERVSRIPAALRETKSLPTEPPFDARGVRRILTTGLGSSAALARFLAALLTEHAQLPAHFVPTGALAKGPPPGAGSDALVVFSQGLSPNARLALARPWAWRHCALVTAEETRDPARRELLAALRRAGVSIWPAPGADEDGLLLRVLGPAAGFVRAAQLAASLGAELQVDPDALAERARAAAERAGQACAALPREAFLGELLLVAAGAHAELADHLRLKLLEGLQRPVPPVCELLEITHGPFQALAERRALVLVLARGDEPDAEQLARLSRVLDPDRHRMVTLRALEAGPLAIVEHEVALDVLVLRAIEALGIDAARWPGRGREAPLYELGAPVEEPSQRPARPSSPLPDMTWPEVAAHLEEGPAVAVVPLGSTEQHGPHLPLATDTWIAEALAARLCARVEGATALPALPFGCAAEHMGFPGTLSLAPETLLSLLADLLRSLDRHGFREIFCFSAHGGNLALLRRADAGLARAVRARVTLFTDHARLSQALSRIGAREGIAPEVAGLHAGELETSLIARLRPGAVRARELAPGLLAAASDAEDLFQPDLRERTASGTVGDPMPARAARADAYLEAWVEVLEEALREARKRSATKGT